MKKVLTFFLILMILFLYGCYGKPGTSSEFYIDSNREIKAEENQILSLVLEANPTTGYSWGWKKEGDLQDKILILLGKPEYTASSERIGSGGEMRYSFKAIGKGKAEIIFEYKRPWEKETEPVRTHTVSVAVE